MTEIPKYDSSLPDCVICDLDGTLALFGDKSPYDREFSEDIPNNAVLSILKGMSSQGCTIIIVTGRKNKYRKVTQAWLDKNLMPIDGFINRNEADKRTDIEVKTDAYEAFIKGRYNVLFVLEDRTRCVKMYRDLGLTCLQVCDGNY